MSFPMDWTKQDIFVASFFCQNCGQAIKLDSSLLDQQALEATKGQGFNTGPLEHLSNKSIRKPPRVPMMHLKSNPIRRSSFPSRLAGPSLHESFIVLPNNNESPTELEKLSKEEENPGNLSHRLRVANKLFEVISGTSQADHPMCINCAEELIAKSEKRIADLKREKDMYNAFVKNLEAQGDPQLNLTREVDEDDSKVKRLM